MVNLQFGGSKPINHSVFQPLEYEFFVLEFSTEYYKNEINTVYKKCVMIIMLCLSYLGNSMTILAKSPCRRCPSYPKPNAARYQTAVHLPRNRTYYSAKLSTLQWKLKQDQTTNRSWNCCPQKLNNRFLLKIKNY